ncbi:MAG: hypothetical protein IJA72_04745 [Clostridia bacterium]|nr:hypothetical protein [Clostridia bacterium]
MIQIDKTDYLYKTLQNLGLEEQEVEDKYTTFAKEGIITAKDFNNYLQAKLGMEYMGDIDENQFSEIIDYYCDIKKNKSPSKSKVTQLLKEYKQNPTEQLKLDIINSQLKDVLLIACAYKLVNNDVNLSDLVQICNIGLMNAVNKYNPESKIAFETYLNYWVLDAIKNEFTQGEKNG